MRGLEGAYIGDSVLQPVQLDECLKDVTLLNYMIVNEMILAICFQY